MQKLTIFLTLIIIFNLPLHAKTKPYLISGFDDVLRQAENTGLFRAALKIFEPDKTFTGMPELYREISKDEKEPHFVLVSAISHWFDSRIENFLTETHYPTHKRYLRNWLTEWSISGFKLEKIAEIMTQNPGREFIVIFDNSDPSLAMARELKRRYPMIKKIYLRMVVEKTLPPEAVGFSTAFDIALSEFDEGRLNIEQIEVVAQAILAESNRELIFPSYALCPKNYSICEKTKFSNIRNETCRLLENHIRTLCQ